MSKRSINRILIYLALAVVLALALWLRRRFIHTVQLYPDEFVTLLAVKMIDQQGWPIMPSGLFYEHGLLFSYLGSLATYWGPARLAVRYASLLFGMLTLLLAFSVGRRWFSPATALIATAGLAIAPVAIHWSGRARMYALLQLLVLLTLWLAYEGVSQNKAYLRWLALLTYLGATLTHFASVTLAPPLVLAGIVLRRSESRAVGPAGGSLRANKSHYWTAWLEPVALGGVLTIAFLVKRVGQPKGVAALDGTAGQALSGLVEVFKIYSDFSSNFVEGWQAIAPFYLTLPALIFTPFALIAIINSFVAIYRLKFAPAAARQSLVYLPTLFLSIILLITTMEMILLVSPDRRDDKYQFMLLPVLLLLGAWGMTVIGKQLSVISYQFLGFKSNTLSSQVSMSDSQALAEDYPDPEGPRTGSLSPPFSSLPAVLPLLVAALIIIPTWPDVQALLSNTGDDYDSAYAYVREHWQDGDTVLTGTPAAAALYLGRNDFYSVQRRGGYDYRILTVANQPVDRWLASPAIRTETALHQTLANHNVWLVLERWGLQREYYDLSFQQQLLAQTEYVTESQGIFVLRSRANPQPIALAPAEIVQATFADLIRLVGYTVEPEKVKPGQSLRLTLYWQALAAMPHDYTVFVHLRHPAGGNVAQADHRPLANFYPTTLWPTGETIRESSDLFLPADLPAGDYDLWTGLYLLETGERLSVQNDTSGENAVRLGVLRVDE